MIKKIKIGVVCLLIWGGMLGLVQFDFVRASQATVVECTNHLAAGYPCTNVNLLSHLSLSEIGGGVGIKGNDHWGWHDDLTGHDYVLFGLEDATSFIDITDRENPIYIGQLPAGRSSWRDIKVYENYGIIAGDTPTTDGLQIFDLTQLRYTLTETLPINFTATAVYTGFIRSHNLWVNEATGYLYALRTDNCASLSIVNIQDPLNPVGAGPACIVPETGLGSDVECLIYQGVDTAYQNQELCFLASDDDLLILDVTDKDNIVSLGPAFGYPGIVRAHQGSLTEDHRYWLISDVMDEPTFGHNTRTHVFDLADLSNPNYLGFIESSSTARDHNLYIIGDIAYQTNWNGGLRLLKLDQLPDLTFHEIGYFDINPASESVGIGGSWSNYPWWGDNVVTISGNGAEASGVDGGLFVVQIDIPYYFMPFMTR